MNRTDIYKEHYFFELNRKQSLTNILVLPVGVLTVICGVIGFYLKNFQIVEKSFTAFIFIVLVIIAIFFIARTIYFLIRSYHNYTYKYIPYTSEINDYYQKLSEYYDIEGNDDKTEREFEKFLNNEYIKATYTNTCNNDTKSEYLHNANSNLIYALITTLLCSFPFFYMYNMYNI